MSMVIEGSLSNIHYISNRFASAAASLKMAPTFGATFPATQRRAEAASSIAGGSTALATTRGLRLATYNTGANADAIVSGPKRMHFEAQLRGLVVGGLSSSIRRSSA